jgi:hypothetical protein
LKEQRESKGNRPVYAICGTGHHSKNSKDKLGKAVRQYLNDYRFAFREFSVPGDRNNVGGILGIDPSSGEKTAVGKVPGGGDADSGVGLGDEARKEDSKVLLVREDPRKVAAGASRELELVGDD